MQPSVSLLNVYKVIVSLKHLIQFYKFETNIAVGQELYCFLMHQDFFFRGGDHSVSYLKERLKIIISELC